MTDQAAVDPGHVYEGWKDISTALKVHEATAKKYGRGRTKVRVGERIVVRPRLPTRLNFKRKVTITADAISHWMAECERLLADEEPVSVDGSIEVDLGAVA
jgi:hypothetical protein